MLKMCSIWYPWTCKKHVFEWKGCQKSLKPEVPTSMKKYQTILSKWSQNPWKIGPRTQQKTKLKNRAQKTEKFLKNHSKMAPKKCRNFGGNAHWDAFGGPNRFCDEKVGPQRSQSAPKNETWAKMPEKLANNELKIASKRAPKVKKSSKSGFFSQPKTMLENRAQTIGKTQKMNSNKSFQSEQSYSIQSRPGGLCEALTIKSTPGPTRPLGFSW